MMMGGQRAMYYVYVPNIFKEIGRLSGKSTNRRLLETKHSHSQTYFLTNCEEFLQYESYPRVTYRDNPWITETLINPRGRVHGSCDNEPIQPSSTSNVSPVENSENVKLVVDLSEFGDDAVVHSESEAEVGEFDEDSEDSTDS
uniref:DUF4216 domain-containing protein n=1 Tax=Brassica oleracea TaxID=3712 RepID=A0A3P6FV22_BRAOL|nr:unnamed protein product [Brassica oleracea]